MPAGFSAAFKRFIHRYVTSVEQIEVMLVLHANPQRAWSVAEISAIVRTNENSIAARLENLKRSGFCTGDRTLGYRYDAPPGLDTMVSELQREYGLRRFSVIEMVFSHPESAQSFADAFRLRDEDEPLG